MRNAAAAGRASPIASVGREAAIELTKLNFSYKLHLTSAPVNATKGDVPVAQALLPVSAVNHKATNPNRTPPIASRLFPAPQSPLCYIEFDARKFGRKQWQKKRNRSKCKSKPTKRNCSANIPIS